MPAPAYVYHNCMNGLTKILIHIKLLLIKLILFDVATEMPQTAAGTGCEWLCRNLADTCLYHLSSVINLYS